MGESNNYDGFRFGLSLSLRMSTSTPFMHQSSEENRVYMRGGIDINQPPPCTAEYDGDVAAAAAAEHSTASTVSGRRSEREIEAVAAEMTTSSVEEEEDDGGDAAAGAARKKLRLSKEQAAVLEDTFKGHSTLNPKQKVALANQLNLKPRQVEVWFQNRRARTKLKQTEIDCEYLRHCCEILAEENRRLHKEVNDLRALKLSPQVYMNMSPPTTLIMCPQCQRPPSTAATGTVSGHRQQPGSRIQWTAVPSAQSQRPR